MADKKSVMEGMDDNEGKLSYDVSITDVILMRQVEVKSRNQAGGNNDLNGCEKRKWLDDCRRDVSAEGLCYNDKMEKRWREQMQLS